MTSFITHYLTRSTKYKLISPSHQKVGKVSLYIECVNYSLLRKYFLFQQKINMDTHNSDLVLIKRKRREETYINLIG